MGFGTPPTPAVELEGDYSTWTEIWEYDFPDGLAGLPIISITFSPEYLCILYEDASHYYRFAIIEITDASSKFTSPSGSDYVEDTPTIVNATFFLFNTLVSMGGACLSILGKYSVIVLDNYTKFEVWKDGVKAWTSPLVSDAVVGASTYDAVGLRYDGKYVVAVTDTKKLVCFEGS